MSGGRMKFWKTESSSDCHKCGLGKKCKNPKLKPFGEGRKGILNVGEAPGENENETGIPFSEETGMYLRDIYHGLGINFVKDCITINAVNCRPFQEEVDKYGRKHVANRTPTDDEINYCRPYVLETIEKVKPKLIMLFGNAPLKSVLNRKDISTMRGFVIPDREVHNAWIAPVFHPSYIKRNKDWDLYAEKLWTKDLQNALNKVDKSFPKIGFKWKVAQTLNEVSDYFKRCFEEKLVVVDWENYPLKPFSKDSLLVCGSFLCPGEEPLIISMEVNSPWDSKEYKTIKNWMFDLFTSDKVTKVAHNLKHERLWARNKLGFDFKPPFDCTMLMNYALDERNDIHGLKFLTWMYYGFRDYDKEIKPFIKKMHTCPTELLYPYGSRDVIFTYKFYNRFMKRFSSLPTVYAMYKELLIGSIDPTLESEYQGAILDFDKLKELKKVFEKKVNKANKTIYSLPLVVKYKKKVHPDFSIGSSTQVKEFLYNFCKIESTKITKKGNPSVDEGVLKELSFYKDKQISLFAKSLMDVRECTTIKSTFLDGIEEVVHDDGLIHTNYNIHTTETGRLSSDSPNLQNIPKREHPEVRAMFTPPKGCLMLSCDYSQWEIRVIQMYCRDPQLGKDIENNIDLHGKYAIELFDVTKKDPNFKKYRHHSKNGFIFPTVYLAVPNSIAKNIKVDVEKVSYVQKKFLERYHYLKEWQDKLVHFYQTHGYVETYFGRRRRAPLEKTKIVNSPIQSTASDFTLKSMKRCKDAGYRTPLMIHDDLTSYVPEKNWVECYYEIEKIMTKWNYEWINVPIEIEAKIGDNWYNQIAVEKIL